MNKNRKSFLLYVDQLGALDCMDDVQAGKLFRAIVAYHKGGKAKSKKYLQDKTVEATFATMRSTFDANAEKYEAKCKHRQEAGRKGGLQRAENQRKEKETNARTVANTSKSKQNVANQADTVTVTGTVTDTDTDTVTDTDTDNVSTTVDDKERYSDEYPKKDGLSLPPSSQSSEKMSFERFNEWLDKKCPYVRKLDMQMTEDEYLWLRRTYTKTQIADGVRALNNWKLLPKKRTSVYQSLSDELTRRYGRQK